jgi:hypothetical protein
LSEFLELRTSQCQDKRGYGMGALLFGQQRKPSNRHRGRHAFWLSIATIFIG